MKELKLDYLNRGRESENSEYREIAAKDAALELLADKLNGDAYAIKRVAIELYEEMILRISSWYAFNPVGREYTKRMYKELVDKEQKEAGNGEGTEMR